VLGSFILAQVTGQFIICLKLFSNGIGHTLEFNSNILCKFIVSKNIQSDMNYILKYYKLQRAARAMVELLLKTHFMHLIDIQLAGVICIHFAK